MAVRVSTKAAAAAVVTSERVAVVVIERSEAMAMEAVAAGRNYDGEKRGRGRAVQG